MRTTPAIRRPDPTAPPEPFTVEVAIRLEDRIAAAQFIYRDLFSAARRRVIYIFAWSLLMLLAMAGFSAWQASGKKDIGAFATRFVSDMFGIAGLPILVIGSAALLYFAIQPALVRGRLRRWYRDERLDRPFEATYRFEPGGILSMVKGQTSAIGCRRIGGFVEQPRHLFVQLPDIDDAIALPKRALTGDQIALVKAWAGSCRADGPGAIQTFPELDTPPADPALTARFVLDESDRAVVLGWQMERPGMKRRRRRGFALAFIVTALIPPILVIFLWLLDRERVPFAYAAPLFLDMFASTFWPWILGFWAIIAVVIATHPWMRRMQTRQLARQLQARVQAYEHEVRLSADHLDTLQDGVRNRFPWAVFERVERRGDHVFLCRRGDEPLVLPVRALEGDKLVAFDDFVDSRIGRDSSQPEAPT